MKANLISEEKIINKIYFIKGQKVMLDRDLAEMYGVETRVLNQAVQRNLNRFPDDFMFQLTEIEFYNLISQIVTSNWGGTRKLPYAFTEQGVAMLSGVLHSESAVQVNIHIIRVFTKLRSLLLTHKDILLKLDKLENQVANHNEDIKLIFDTLRKLIQQPEPPRKRIGFKTDD